MLLIPDLEIIHSEQHMAEIRYRQESKHDDGSCEIKKNINFFFLFFENCYCGHHSHEISISARRLEV